MKTILKVTLVIALAAFANTVFASGNLKVNVLPVSTDKAVVAISTLTNSNFKITVTDEKGTIVYFNENTDPGENYRRIYNFSNLEDGTYKLSVACDKLTAERILEKSFRGINVGEEKTTLEPFFGYEDGILRCSYLNFMKENVTLYFYEKNQLIYTKEIGRNFSIVEGLNLSKLGSGNYVAVLSTGNKDYSYPISVR